MDRTQMLRSPPPGVAGSISRGSFRDTRVANDFSPFGSVHEFNALSRQTAAPSPFLSNVRPGSLHTNQGTPMHRSQGIRQALSRRDSMSSFYVDGPVGRRHPDPDDLFSDHGDPPSRPNQPPREAQEHFNYQQNTPHVGMHTNLHQATPRGHPRIMEDDEDSVRYGSLYGEPYGVTSKTPVPPTRVQQPLHAAPPMASSEHGSKLSRHSKFSKMSGFSVLRKPRQPPAEPDGNHLLPAKAAPYISQQPSIAEESLMPQASGAPSVPRQPNAIEHSSRPDSAYGEMSYHGTPYVPPRAYSPNRQDPPQTPYIPPARHPPPANPPIKTPTAMARPASMMDHVSIRSVSKINRDGFPFEQEGDDLVAQVWLPWTDKLKETPCIFQVNGLEGEPYWCEVDYTWKKVIHGTVKFHGAGMPRSGGKGRGRLIVEWEIALQEER